MDPSQLQFPIRSGAGEALDYDTIYSLMAMSAFFLQKATEKAGEYSRAANRQTIHGKDVILCMKYLALPQNNFYQTENLLQQVQEWKQRLVEENYSDEDDSEHDEVNSHLEDEVFTYAESLPEINSAEELFESWTPTDPMEMIVRRAIVRAELQML